MMLLLLLLVVRLLLLLLFLGKLVDFLEIPFRGEFGDMQWLHGGLLFVRSQ